MEAFHFLRPLWLLAMPATAALWWLVRRREARRADVAGFVAPHLRAALTVHREATRGFRPVDGVALVVLAAALAAAGPTWSKQVSPWFEETAPVVVAMEVTDSMRSNDLLPTRLERARFKVEDLIRTRTGARTALIAYAGSAHIVMPPSKDAEVLGTFLESLDPAIMPDPGTRAQAVLPLAREILGDRGAAGTLLFVNDGFEASDLPALAAFAAEPGAPSMAALVVGTEEGGVALLPDGSPVLDGAGERLDTRIDVGMLRRAGSDAEVSVVRAEAAGDGDVRRLVRILESNLRQADDPDAVWRDRGEWLLWPAALLALFWFRKGWTMRW